MRRPTSRASGCQSRFCIHVSDIGIQNREKASRRARTRRDTLRQCVVTCPCKTLHARLCGKIENGCVPTKLKFFIAPSPDPRGHERERTLFEALNGSSATELVLGWHDARACTCGKRYHLDGAHNDLYDTALLITGDEDYELAILARAVKNASGVNPDFEKRVVWGHFGTQATNGRLATAETH